MATKLDLSVWIHDILKGSVHGSLHLIDMAKEIWHLHEGELRASGDLFYTWQYDMRWACTVLGKKGVIKNLKPGIWGLVKTAEGTTCSRKY